jgi:hypothetical protein
MTVGKREFTKKCYPKVAKAVYISCHFGYSQAEGTAKKEEGGSEENYAYTR